MRAFIYLVLKFQEPAKSLVNTGLEGMPTWDPGQGAYIHILLLQLF